MNENEKLKALAAKARKIHPAAGLEIVNGKLRLNPEASGLLLAAMLTVKKQENDPPSMEAVVNLIDNLIGLLDREQRWWPHWLKQELLTERAAGGPLEHCMTVDLSDYLAKAIRFHNALLAAIEDPDLDEKDQVLTTLQEIPDNAAI